MSLVHSNRRTNWTPTITNSANAIPSLPGATGATATAGSIAVQHATFVRLGMQVLFWIRFTTSVTWGAANFLNLNVTLPVPLDTSFSNTGDATGVVSFAVRSAGSTIGDLNGLVEADLVNDQIKIGLRTTRTPAVGAITYAISCNGVYEVV